MAKAADGDLVLYLQRKEEKSVETALSLMLVYSAGSFQADWVFFLHEHQSDWLIRALAFYKQGPTDLMRILLLLLLFTASLEFGMPATGIAVANETPSHPASLFNGRNLEGWFTYLEGKGKNNDPEKVFQVHDGVLHVYRDAEEGTKMPFGYVATKREFADYHLRLQYRWGTKLFAPRAQDKRDSGLLYHVVGPDKVWPCSVELQIQEGDTGDIFTVNTRVTSTLDLRYLVPDEPKQWTGSAFLEPNDGGVERSQGGDWISRIVKSGRTKWTAGTRSKRSCGATVPFTSSTVRSTTVVGTFFSRVLKTPAG